MTPAELEALARRAVACKRWRWMPGMLYKQRRCGVRPEAATAPIIQGGGLPDLTDPATLGCLLALVREAWGGPTLGLWCDFVKTIWIVGDYEGELATAPTEAEALVAALEVAP
jgi:hypothetical protein